MKNDDFKIRLIDGVLAMYAEYCVFVAESSNGVEHPIPFNEFKNRIKDAQWTTDKAKQFVKDAVERSKIKRPTHPEASDMDAEERADVEFAAMTLDEKRHSLNKCSCDGCRKLLFKLNRAH